MARHIQTLRASEGLQMEMVCQGKRSEVNGCEGWRWIAHPALAKKGSAAEKPQIHGNWPPRKLRLTFLESEWRRAGTKGHQPAGPCDTAAAEGLHELKGDREHPGPSQTILQENRLGMDF